MNNDPGPLFYVWEWFLELHKKRVFDGTSGAYLPIPYTEICAWQSLSGVTLATHEFRLINQMDDIFIAADRKEIARRNKKKS